MQSCGVFGAAVGGGGGGGGSSWAVDGFLALARADFPGSRGSGLLCR